MENKKQIRMLTTGMHVFPVLRRNEKAKYVDKTALLYELCNDADQQLFISRTQLDVCAAETMPLPALLY